MAPVELLVFWHWLLACLAGVASATNARSEPERKPDDVVRIETGLVQTDVMVLDKNHQFVKGLKPAQFRLQLNGKPREILFFEEVGRKQ